MQTNNKLREALVTMRRRLIAMYESEAEFRRLSHNKPLVDLIDAALSKPPRNCDRFNTGDVKQDAQDAMEAILDEGVAGFRGIAEYLLSPVCTEQKGEDNGNK